MDEDGSGEKEETQKGGGREAAFPAQPSPGN